MSVYTIAGLVLAAWAMLSVVGSERQRELTACRRKIAAERAAAEGDAPAAPAPTTAPAANSTKSR